MVKARGMDLAELQTAADRACNLLKVLSNRDRLMLLCQMTQGEFSVGELEEMTGIQQPTLSQQLTILRSKKLVSTRREGKNIFYRIAGSEAVTVLKTLYQIYCPQDKSAK